jgi:citrate lyase subunit beta/citryl-CoA lyase
MTRPPRQRHSVRKIDAPRRPLLRSRLYVPATKTEWLGKAVAAGADAVILDLEDSVSAADKGHAREAATEAVRQCRTDPVLFVRVNDLASPIVLDDLEAVVRPGLFGLVVPKADPDQIVALDIVLSWLESRAGMPQGSVVISPILETASAVHHAYDIVAASPRVDYVGGIATNGGDIHREVGYRWSRSACESVPLRALTLIEVRAAGAQNPMTGIWTALDDPEGLVAFAEQGRGLGYTGMDVIHPSHVATVNAAFAPDEERLEEARALLAVAGDMGAARFKGQMIDQAMVRTAKALLRQAGDLD